MILPINTIYENLRHVVALETLDKSRRFYTSDVEIVKAWESDLYVFVIPTFGDDCETGFVYMVYPSDTLFEVTWFNYDNAIANALMQPKNLEAQKALLDDIIEKFSE